ncbi:hypothetical protein MHB50_04230 [Siminovitchia sp. FSL H7-0308]|uniref:Uncharacterized protein n=1 Tax=Siminovitchia thermophila TaxID=1245522 RepID=A0ABS2R8T4_9BACI|nr:hypothetical protein [Siminovitchia thermophila]MBM7715258.1 hypothetical protein [Siminovitchia thermophila]ONK24021.1 hypothetical protein BLX87_07185 [Bacillus sp. VT-16-64]
MKKLKFFQVRGPKQDYIGDVREGLQAKWPHDARVVVNIAVNYEEGSEQMKASGNGSIEQDFPHS